MEEDKGRSSERERSHREHRKKERKKRGWEKK
jgi:hypothetical protein